MKVIIDYISLQVLLQLTKPEIITEIIAVYHTDIACITAGIECHHSCYHDTFVKFVIKISYINGKDRVAHTTYIQNKDINRFCKTLLIV